MRIAFMGTPEFAVPTLEALIAAGHDIAAVYTQPPRRAGRGKKEQKSAVHRKAEAAGLQVITPNSLKAEDIQADFAALNLDYAIVVAYGQILPKPILTAPRYGCVNVHASLLPRWRGAAPIHRAIMAGDSETGVCIMLMEEGLDTGPVLAEIKTPILAQDTTQDLHDRLAALGGTAINDALEGYADGSVTPRPQSEESVTYAHKIDKVEAKIDWTLPAEQVARTVRALAPFPGAWCMLGGDRIKILAGDVLTSTGQPGHILTSDFIIACGEGAYRPTKVQKAGKGVMAIDDFLRGQPVAAGVVVD